MRLGIPRESATDEFRVAISPAGVRALSQRGHSVLIEEGAGAGSGISDADFAQAGARLMARARDVYAADLVLKIKAPEPAEYDLLREGQVLFSFLHLAPSPELARALIERQVTAIAYETIEAADGSLPVLLPMSEVAGRLAVQVGARWLEKSGGGRGQLLGGVAGTRPGKVVILGAGVVGTNAALTATGLGAAVTLFDPDLARLRSLQPLLGGRATLLASSSYDISQELVDADLVIGAALDRGARTPRLISRTMLATMPPASVLVDVSVDQGGCAETSRPTTHSDPTYTVDGVIHYCVANMPSAVARTATFALTNATLPYTLMMAELGHVEALLRDPGLLKGLNVIDGQIVCAPVARDLGASCAPPEEILH